MLEENKCTIIQTEVNLEKRKSVKDLLFKAGVVGAGLIGVSALANAQSIFYRDDQGNMTDLKNNGGSGNAHCLIDASNCVSADGNGRKLYNDQGCESADWNATNGGVIFCNGLYVDKIGSVCGATAFEINPLLGVLCGNYSPSVDYANRILYACDGCTVNANWSQPGIFNLCPCGTLSFGVPGSDAYVQGWTTGLALSSGCGVMNLYTTGGVTLSGGNFDVCGNSVLNLCSIVSHTGQVLCFNGCDCGYCFVCGIIDFGASTLCNLGSMCLNNSIINGIYSLCGYGGCAINSGSTLDLCGNCIVNVASICDGSGNLYALACNVTTPNLCAVLTAGVSAGGNCITDLANISVCSICTYGNTCVIDVNARQLWHNDGGATTPCSVLDWEAQTLSTGWTIQDAVGCGGKGVPDIAFSTYYRSLYSSPTYGNWHIAGGNLDFNCANCIIGIVGIYDASGNAFALSCNVPAAITDNCQIANGCGYTCVTDNCQIGNTCGYTCFTNANECDPCFCSWCNSGSPSLTSLCVGSISGPNSCVCICSITCFGTNTIYGQYLRASNSNTDAIDLCYQCLYGTWSGGGFLTAEVDPCFCAWCNSGCPSLDHIGSATLYLGICNNLGQLIGCDNYISVDWGTRSLITSTGTTLDWVNKCLCGGWVTSAVLCNGSDAYALACNVPGSQGLCSVLTTCNDGGANCITNVKCIYGCTVDRGIDLDFGQLVGGGVGMIYYGAGTTGNMYVGGDYTGSPCALNTYLMGTTIAGVCGASSAEMHTGSLGYINNYVGNTNVFSIDATGIYAHCNLDICGNCLSNASLQNILGVTGCAGNYLVFNTNTGFIFCGANLDLCGNCLVNYGNSWITAEVDPCFCAWCNSGCPTLTTVLGPTGSTLTLQSDNCSGYIQLGGGSGCMVNLGVSGNPTQLYLSPNIICLYSSCCIMMSADGLKCLSGTWQTDGLCDSTGNLYALACQLSAPGLSAVLTTSNDACQCSICNLTAITGYLDSNGQSPIYCLNVSGGGTFSGTNYLSFGGNNVTLAGDGLLDLTALTTICLHAACITMTDVYDCANSGIVSLSTCNRCLIGGWQTGTVLCNGTDVYALCCQIPTDNCQLGNTCGYMANPMTSAGDLIYGGVSGVPTVLSTSGAPSTPYYPVLTLNQSTGLPEWIEPGTIPTDNCQLSNGCGYITGTLGAMLNANGNCIECATGIWRGIGYTTGDSLGIDLTCGSLIDYYGYCSLNWETHTLGAYVTGTGFYVAACWGTGVLTDASGNAFALACNLTAPGLCSVLTTSNDACACSIVNVNVLQGYTDTNAMYDHLWVTAGPTQGTYTFLQLNGSDACLRADGSLCLTAAAGCLRLYAGCQVVIECNNLYDCAGNAYALSCSIPTDNCQLSNTCGYTCVTDNSQIANGCGYTAVTDNSQIANGCGYAVGTIPTCTSQLTNDSNFIINCNMYSTECILIGVDNSQNTKIYGGCGTNENYLQFCPLSWTGVELYSSTGMLLCSPYTGAGYEICLATGSCVMITSSNLDMCAHCMLNTKEIYSTTAVQGSDLNLYAGNSCDINTLHAGGNVNIYAGYWYGAALGTGGIINLTGGGNDVGGDATISGGAVTDYTPGWNGAYLTVQGGNEAGGVGCGGFATLAGGCGGNIGGKILIIGGEPNGYQCTGIGHASICVAGGTGYCTDGGGVITLNAGVTCGSCGCVGHIDLCGQVNSFGNIDLCGNCLTNVCQINAGLTCDVPVYNDGVTTGMLSCLCFSGGILIGISVLP